MLTSQIKNVSNILCIITQSSKKSFQYGVILLLAFCDISDNIEITLEIKKTESFYCRGINLHLLFNVPILKYLFLFYLFLAKLCLCFYVQAFSSCGEWHLLSSCIVQASHCGGFS